MTILTRRAVLSLPALPALAAPAATPPPVRWYATLCRQAAEIAAPSLSAVLLAQRHVDLADETAAAWREHAPRLYFEHGELLSEMRSEAVAVIGEAAEAAAREAPRA